MRAPRAKTVERLRAPDELALFSACVLSATPLELAEGDALLYPAWLARPVAGALLASLRDGTPWHRERRMMYDRLVDVPREQAWFGDARAWRRDGAQAELETAPAAALPGTEVAVRAWTPELARVRDDLQLLVGRPFACVLVNRYRDGRDSVAWHNDRLHPALPEPTIASLSLGATRAFDLRAKARPGAVVSIDLAHGDLLVMRGAMQRRYDHRVRKDPRVTGERLNLTFREQPH